MALTDARGYTEMHLPVAEGAAMKRRIARTALLLAVAGILFFYPLIAPPAHRIDESHLAMVRPGMTEADVEGIFGVPPGEYDWAVANDAGAIWLDLAIQSPWSAPKQYRYTVTMLRAGDLDLAVNSWTRADYYTRTWTSRHGAFC